MKKPPHHEAAFRCSHRALRPLLGRIRRRLAAMHAQCDLTFFCSWRDAASPRAMAPGSRACHVGALACSVTFWDRIGSVPWHSSHVPPCCRRVHARCFAPCGPVRLHPSLALLGARIPNHGSAVSVLRRQGCRDISPGSLPAQATFAALQLLRPVKPALPTS